jgi:hypothetical protein
LSELPEDDEHPSQPSRPSLESVEDEIPRQGILSAIPKRTFFRVVVLLAALAGILYLRQRTAAIASCMSDAFRIPPTADQKHSPSSVKARVVLPTDLEAPPHR